jgi:hypothetical protein
MMLPFENEKYCGRSHGCSQEIIIHSSSSIFDDVWNENLHLSSILVDKFSFMITSQLSTKTKN